MTSIFQRKGVFTIPLDRLEELMPLMAKMIVVKAKVDLEGITYTAYSHLFKKDVVMHYSLEMLVEKKYSCYVKFDNDFHPIVDYKNNIRTYDTAEEAHQAGRNYPWYEVKELI